MTALWLLLGAVVLLVPDPRGRPAPGFGPRVSRPVHSLQVFGLQARSLPILSGALAAVAGLVLFGPQTGVPVAAFVAPTVGLLVRTAGRRSAPMRVDRSVARTLDLAAAGLHSGRPVGEALSAAAPAAQPEAARALLGVAGLLRLGAEPEQAWSTVAAGPLGPVAVTAIRSAESGIRLAAAFERLAAEIRAEAAAAAAARAHRAGVTAMAPLAACFLPSFVCLGIIPVIVGIAGSALGVLR